MWSDCVVVLSPAFNEHLCLLQCVEDLAIEQLISELAVEAFIVAVLPGAAWLDVESLDADPAEPSPNRLGGELGPVVRADMIR
jgi:hypothetical protein